MEQKNDYLIIKLLAGVAAGLGIGFISNADAINWVQSVKYILGQIIFFMVPLIILGFVAPAITKLRSNAGKMLGAMLALAYLSSIGAAFFSAALGYTLIPMMNIRAATEGLQELPAMLFKLDIPPLFPVMSALVFALALGMAVIAVKAELFDRLLDEFNDLMLFLVQNLIVPILPFFIASTFAVLAYEGSITKQFPVFIAVIAIVIVCHWIWLAVLYAIGGAVSGKNPWRVLKHYGPAYLTAVGTMSSAATLPISLECARKSDALDAETTNFAIPLGATVHLCGSVLTEVFFVMTVSQVLYGSLPSSGTMLVFILLLGVFAVGAPGVPGGTVMASLGLIISVLGFDDTGTALMLTIFALQDSFGTACNVTGDGALAMILDGIFKRNKG